MDFKRVLDSKLLRDQQFNFSGVWFPQYLYLRERYFNHSVDFRNATFAEGADFCGVVFKQDAHFSETIFIGPALFSDLEFRKASNFVHAEFQGDASFSIAQFAEKAEFAKATFQKQVDFGSARFICEADFSYGTFMADVRFSHTEFHGPVDFTGTKFSSLANFESSTFLSYVRFAGDDQREVFCGKSVLDLQHSRIARPEAVSFHTAVLHTSWFVNVDSRKFVFAEIKWGLDNSSIKKEIESLTTRQVASPYLLLATVCRQLAENAGSNNRYEEASSLRYWAMDIVRQTKWGSWSFWRTDWLHMIYWAVSGYGERILRSLCWLVIVWIIFALLYTQVGFTPQTPKPSNESLAATSDDTTGQPLELSRSLTYSLTVMSLQKPDPRPLTNWAHTLVTLEMILGPVQAALLVLAIRRKFLR